jgi:hypothetical protein
MLSPFLLLCFEVKHIGCGAVHCAVLPLVGELRGAMSVLETVAHLATTMAAVATIVSPAAAMAAGFAPRLGPGRAVALALRSRLGSAGTRSSQRDADVKVFQAMTANAARDQYCVVMGPKGVGEFAAPRDAPRHFQFARLFPPLVRSFLVQARRASSTPRRRARGVLCACASMRALQRRRLWRTPFVQ